MLQFALACPIIFRIANKGLMAKISKKGRYKS
jgi:hypothetical protein